MKMQDIKTLATNYAYYLLQTNPQLEFWSNEYVDENNKTVLRPSGEIPAGLPMKLISARMGCRKSQ